MTEKIKRKNKTDETQKATKLLKESYFEIFIDIDHFIDFCKNSSLNFFKECEDGIILDVAGDYVIENLAPFLEKEISEVMKF